MRKFLATLLIGVSLLGVSTGALAGGHYHGYGYRGGWVAPFAVGALIGGAVTYAATPRYYPQPVYVQPQPVYIQPQPVQVVQQVYFPDCNCYRPVLVQQ